jgi:hypothetical protein
LLEYFSVWYAHLSQSFQKFLNLSDDSWVCYVVQYCGLSE